MSKTLLVLAASRYQVDAIRTAKRLGLRVITTDNVPDNPGHQLADRSYGVDTTDLAAVLELARAEAIDGIIAPCTDVAVATAAYVAHELRLPGVPLPAARILTDKIAFREYLAAQALPHPRFVELTRGASLADLRALGGTRWIIKPDKASGSKGVFIVESESELRERLPESQSFSPTGRVLLEEFLEGHQGTCEGVMRGGKAVLSFVLDRQTAHPPYVTTTGHYLPSVLSRAAQETIVANIEAVFARMGVSDSVFDCDFVWRDGEVFLLEMTPRLGGNSISQLLRHATGLDLVEIAVSLAVGAESALPRALAIRPTALVLLGVWREGPLMMDELGATSVRREPWLRDLTFDVNAGSWVQPFIHGRHRLGEAFLSAEARDELPQLVEQLERALALSVGRERAPRANDA